MYSGLFNEMMVDSDAQTKAEIVEPLETVVETELEDVPVTEIDPVPETVIDEPQTDTDSNADIWAHYDRIMDIMQ